MWVGVGVSEGLVSVSLLVFDLNNLRESKAAVFSEQSVSTVYFSRNKMNTTADPSPISPSYVSDTSLPLHGGSSSLRYRSLSACSARDSGGVFLFSCRFLQFLQFGGGRNRSPSM
jgi:hypothetical protein